MRRAPDFSKRRHKRLVGMDTFPDQEASLDGFIAVVARSLREAGCNCDVDITVRPISRHDPEYEDFKRSGNAVGLHVESMHKGDCPAGKERL